MRIFERWYFGLCWNLRLVIIELWYLEGFWFEDYVFAWWNIWVSIIYFGLKIIFNVNGKATVWHTPFYYYYYYYYFMDNKKFEVVVPVKLKIGCIGSQTPYHNGVGQNSKAWHQHEGAGEAYPLTQNIMILDDNL